MVPKSVVLVFAARSENTTRFLLSTGWRCRLIVLAALYLSLPEQRLQIFKIGIGAIGGLAVIVGLFAWLNIKNLVYGEAGHRAESKFKFGSDKGEITAGQLATTPGTPNPRLPSSEHAPSALPSDGGAQ